MNAINRLLNQNQSPKNDVQGLLQSAQKLKSELAGKDPQAVVQNLVNSGKVSQTQVNNALQQAQSLLSILR